MSDYTAKNDSLSIFKEKKRRAIKPSDLFSIYIDVAEPQTDMQTY